MPIDPQNGPKTPPSPPAAFMRAVTAPNQLPQADKLQKWLETRPIQDEDRDHTASEREQFWRRCFLNPRGYALATTPTDPLADYPGLFEARANRIVVAWRITRMLGHCTGFLHETETLKDAWGTLDPSPWSAPLSALRARAAPSALIRPAWAREIRDLLLLPPASPLAPPDIPENQRNNTHYDPRDPNADPALHRWCTAAERAAAKLQIGETPYGRHGLRYMLDPYTTRDVYPTKEEVETMEEGLVAATLESLIRAGDRATFDWLRATYALSIDECTNLMTLVDEQSERIATRTTEQWKTRILARQDALLEQANQACDLRTQRSLLRDIATVSGVLKLETGDFASEMLRGVDQLDAERKTRKTFAQDEDDDEATGTDG